jgi:hypothetical protein
MWPMGKSLQPDRASSAAKPLAMCDGMTVLAA